MRHVILGLLLALTLTIGIVSSTVETELAAESQVAMGPQFEPHGLRLAMGPLCEPNGLRLAMGPIFEPNGLRAA